MLVLLKVAVIILMYLLMLVLFPPKPHTKAVADISCELPTKGVAFIGSKAGVDVTSWPPPINCKAGYSFDCTVNLPCCGVKTFHLSSNEPIAEIMCSCGETYPIVQKKDNLLIVHGKCPECHKDIALASRP